MRRILAVIVALAACAKPPPPSAPSAIVRAEVKRAEDAELERRHDVARAAFESAIEKATDPPSIHFARREFAETLITWGEVESARGQLEKALAAVPDDPVAWQMLGLVRNGLGDVTGAFEALERSKQLAPRAWIPRRDLAALHFKLALGRDAAPDPAVAARHRAAALAEYCGMLELDLPDRLREKVKWAIGALSNAEAAPPSP